jgi:hypothetical protein
VWRSTILLVFFVLLTACPLPTDTSYQLLPQAASALTCQLSGTPNAGELWTVDRAGSQCSHTVADLETLPAVAAGLALALDALDGVTAGVEGSVIACVQLSGAPLVIDLSVSTPASATVDSTTALTKLVYLAGGAVAGENWSIQIDGVAFGYTVTAGDSLQEVASALGIAIDLAADYVGHAEMTTVAVTRVSGGSFSLTTTPPAGGSATADPATATTQSIVLSGPYNAADTWSVDLAGDICSYVVRSGDTAADVVTALAAALGSVSAFTVGSEGERIVITRVAGDPFELAAAVTPSGGGTVDGTTATAVALAVSGPVIAGDTWTISLNATEHCYTVQPGDDAAGLAAAIAGLVDGEAGYVAAAEGSVFTITRIAGGELSIDLTVDPQ